MLLKGDVASTLFTISISEGLVRQLDPSFDVAEQALPYITKYMGSGKKVSSWHSWPAWMEIRWDLDDHIRWKRMKLRWNQRWSKDKPSEKPGKQPGAGWATWLTLVGQHLVGQFHRLVPQPAVFLGSPELQSRLVRTCGATLKNRSLVHFERWQIGEILKLFDIWADFNPGHLEKFDPLELGSWNIVCWFQPPVEHWWLLSSFWFTDWYPDIPIQPHFGWPFSISLRWFPSFGESLLEALAPKKKTST